MLKLPVLVIVALAMATQFALANPNDQVIADCGEFDFVQTILTDPDTGAVSSITLSAQTRLRSVELKKADRVQIARYGSRTPGAQLFAGELNENEDLYVERIERAGFPIYRSFYVRSGKKDAVKTCVNQ